METIIFRSASAQFHQINNDGSISFSYSLAKEHNFSDQNFVKLLKIWGEVRNIYVYSDFVEPQDVGGKLVPILGCSIESANTWVPLKNNTIPKQGWLTLTSVSGNPIKTRKNITIWLAVAPKISFA